MRYAATRLATEREKRGWTQGQLGTKIGVSTSAVCGIENRHIKAWPKFKRNASAALGIPEIDLFPEPALGTSSLDQLEILLDALTVWLADQRAEK